MAWFYQNWNEKRIEDKVLDLWYDGNSEERIADELYLTVYEVVNILKENDLDYEETKRI